MKSIMVDTVKDTVNTKIDKEINKEITTTHVYYTMYFLK